MVKFEPKMISVELNIQEEGNNCEAKFIVEPLERGYGTTIGNSLRRILLSALPGAAARGIKIEGVQHEFSTIPGIKEEVAEIAMNVKGIYFKLDNFSEIEDVDLSLRKNTIGPVVAGDIRLIPGVTILNPEHHICTLDKGSDLDMTITIGVGRGYVQAQENKSSSRPIGFIPLDSIYTPVIRASYEIESARVGQNVDYDKLILSVKTDGTVTAREAVSLSAKILQEHATLFVNLEEDIKKVEVFNKEEPVEEKSYDISIEELGLATRSSNGLRREGIETLKDLLSRTEAEILEIPNLGVKSVEDIKEKLAEKGLSFSTKLN